LNVTINQSGALSSFTVANDSPTFTGNFTNNNGTVNINRQNGTPLGPPGVAGRTLVFNNSP